MPGDVAKLYRDVAPALTAQINFIIMSCFMVPVVLKPESHQKFYPEPETHTNYAVPQRLLQVCKIL
jgi:hypothetical protein